MRVREVQLLEKLCMAFGPSGCEDAVAHILRETLMPYADAVTEDRLGTLILLYRGSGAPSQSALVENRLMLAAHMDEPGFMIQSIDEKGYPHPTKLSVQDGSILTGRSVTVGNADHQISGYMGAMPAHKSGGTAKMDTLYVDIGAKNKEEAEKKLQFVPFNNTYEEVKLDIDSCGFDGCEVDKNGVAIRWED